MQVDSFMTTIAQNSNSFIFANSKIKLDLLTLLIQTSGLLAKVSAASQLQKSFLSILFLSVTHCYYVCSVYTFLP